MDGLKLLDVTIGGHDKERTLSFHFFESVNGRIEHERFNFDYKLYMGKQEFLDALKEAIKKIEEK